MLELVGELATDQNTTTRPIASRGQTCNWDKNNYVSQLRVVSGLLQLEGNTTTNPIASRGGIATEAKEMVRPRLAQLRVDGGLATRAQNNIRPSCEFMVDL